MAGMFSCCIGFSEKMKYTKNQMVITSVEDALAHLSSAVPYWPDDNINLHHQLRDLQLQFRFLKMFLWFFPQWDSDDENLLSRFSYIVTKIESARKDAGSFFNARYWIGWTAVELKDPVQKCKAEIKKKYIKHLISSSFKSHAFKRNDTLKFLDFIHVCMNGLVYDNSAPGKSHIEALKERLLLFKDLIHFTVPKTMRDFEFYVYDWANKAARLTILYWLNEQEQDEETGDKLKVLHHDLLLKTPELTRLCFGIIKVPKVIRSDTVIFGEFLSRFLDFFLENMVFALKDDVPMLREGLILLITFLADPPEYAMDQHSGLPFFQNKIHAVLDQASQTFSFFSETNVIHLQKSIDEVREKIERLSWFPHFFEYRENPSIKMVISSVEDALAHLSYMPDYIHVHQVKDLQLQFGFLKMFLWFFPQWGSDDEIPLSRFSYIATNIESACKFAPSFSNARHRIVCSVVELKDPVQKCKAEIKKYIEQLISCSLKSQPFKRNEAVKFLDFIHVCMNGLVVDSAPGKSQIKALKERLLLLRDFIHFTVPMSGGEENHESEVVALDFELYVYDWANKAARLTILYWLNEQEQDEETGDKLKVLHHYLLLKTPELTRLCFGIIIVPKVIRSDTLIFGEFLSRFLDFFLENMVFALKDDVLMLREGLILLITFLADPPPNAMYLQHSEHLSFFQNKILAVLDQASHTISLFDETSMDLARGKSNVVHLQKSIDEVREKIERFYVQIPHSSWSNYFPRTDGLGHFESLLVYLENLKEEMNKNKMLVPFLKHRIFAIKEELTLLRPLLQGIWKMQNEHGEVKDLREQITCLSYQSDLAIKSSFFIDHPIWYNLTCLSFVVEKIKDIQSNVMRIKDICRTEVVPPLMRIKDISTSIVEAVVGFKRETEVMIDRLTRGSAKLEIVSIVGMGGIGKTTLAKKLFNEPSIRYHFHKRSFCSVSQEYIKRNVLLDILSDLCTIDDKLREMCDDDLAHMLKKCLSGCKYLIVMDDIWDIDAWYDVRPSFPDDNMGSRVLFTTRISNISLTAKPESSPYLLPFLSVDESWELLKRNIFHKDLCPPHLCEVGKLIAKKCQGLPLAIVVIAGLLTRMELHLSHWNEVADALTTFASGEGCMDVIRLSYKRLPEPLKSCFLYLGVFREDEMIEAKMLTNLWVAEGFVLKSGISFCLRKVAKQYLNELGDRNLVIVTCRSCNGGIKHFKVHDLIRDFCRTEAQEQHYWCFINSHNSKVSTPSVCDQYRICNEDEWRSFVDSKPRGPTVHSLLHYSKYYCREKSLESFLCNFKLVQVLDLRMVVIDVGFPKAVTTLVHLRYLALRIRTSFVKVPSEINNLWNLGTLLILALSSRYLKVEFPYDIWKMKKLWHVETNGEARVAIDDDVSGGILPQLPDLETFTSLVIPPGKDGVELLRRLPNVRKLNCLIDGWYQMPKLDILTNLESFQMREDIGQGFARYPLKFNCFPLTIRKLTIEIFKVRWNEFIAVIRKLPTLQVLVLRRTKSSEDAKIWDVEDEEFPNIKSLTLDDLDIEEWKASIDSFPCIEKLNLSDCKHLIQIPPCFGEVPALNSVMVRFCSKGVADSALQIQKDQLDSGYEMNLEVVGTY